LNFFSDTRFCICLQLKVAVQSGNSESGEDLENADMSSDECQVFRDSDIESSEEEDNATLSSGLSIEFSSGKDCDNYFSEHSDFISGEFLGKDPLFGNFSVTVEEAVVNLCDFL